MGQNNKNKDKTKSAKPAAEKKPRKARAPMRSRKESPAGHFADKLKAYSKQANDVMKKIEGFPGVAEASGTAEIVAALEKLAAEGFKPTGKRGGRKATFSVGQEVKFKPDFAATVAVDQPEVTGRLFVSFSYKPETDGDTIPVRAGGPNLGDGPLVGRFSRKLLTTEVAASA
jgi:hypothetical protein